MRTFSRWLGGGLAGPGMRPMGRGRWRRPAMALCAAALGWIALGSPQAWASGSASYFTALTGASLTEGRNVAVAATLPSGRVLIAGGDEDPAGAELFNPATDRFTKLMGAGGSLTEEREFAVAATLRSGEVLIAGGGPGSASSAELFNPATNTFTKLASTLTEARRGAVASTLPSGQVLIAGGAAGGSETLSSAELFDPTTDTFSKLAATMTEGREHAVAATLPNGEVLIAGGVTGIKGPHLHSQTIVSSAELFNPATDTFAKLMGPEQSLTEAREGAVATALSNGKVLIAGGEGPSSIYPLSSAEMFDPASDTFRKLTGPEQSLTVGRKGASAATLPNGYALIAGGEYRGDPFAAELFNPVKDTFTKLPGREDSLTGVREGAVGATLPSGQVLIAGGNSSETSAELFNPSTDVFTALTGTSQSLTVARDGAVAATLSSGDVLIAGGESTEVVKEAVKGGPVGCCASSRPTSSAELFDPKTHTFSKLAGPLTEGREFAVAATLPSGQVLIAGGDRASSALSSAELFNPATETFTELTGAGHSLTEAREGAVAARLPNGRVLIAGGYSQNAGFLSSVELFDPTTDKFTKLENSLSEPRDGAVATPLPNGEVLIAGGHNSDGNLKSTELFDPSTGVFTELTGPEQSLAEARDKAIAATLPNGDVLIAGGDRSSVAELFVLAEVELVTCQGKKHTHCTTKPMNRPSTIKTSIKDPKATLRRAGTLYGTGTFSHKHRSLRLVLDLTRHKTLRAGTYTLRLTWKTGKTTHTNRQRIRIK